VKTWCKHTTAAKAAERQKQKQAEEEKKRKADQRSAVASGVKALDTFLQKAKFAPQKAQKL